MVQVEPNITANTLGMHYRLKISHDTTPISAVFAHCFPDNMSANVAALAMYRIFVDKVEQSLVQIAGYIGGLGLVHGVFHGAFGDDGILQVGC